MTQMNLSMEQKQTHRHREQTSHAKGEGLGEGMDRESGMSRCKLVYIGWINNKVLLYSTGNYIQYAVINHNGKEYEKECVYIYIYIYIYMCVCVCVCVYIYIYISESLFCILETNTTL